MNVRTCTIREIQRRPWRMLLTLLGISLGLATVVATRLTTHTVSGDYRELFESAVGGDALEVTAPGMSAFATDWADQLTSVPGVKAVVPRIRGAAGVVGATGGVTTPVVGVDPLHAGDWRLHQGKALAGNDEALLDVSLADSLGVAPGQTFRLWTPAGLAPLRLAGIVEAQGSTASSGGLLVVSLETARRLLTVPAGQVNCLLVTLQDKAVSERVQAAASQCLPAGLTLHAPGCHGSLARSTLMAAEQGLSALGVMALITAAFVIFNTFLLNLGERRRQLALLKTLGASRWQVLRLLLGEALLLGVVGTVLGCALGTGLSVVLLRLMERFLRIALPPLQLTPGPFLLAGLLGPGTPLVAACLPAWRASCRPALCWLLPGRGDECEVSCRLVGLLGLLLLCLGVGPAAGLCLGWFPGAVGETVLPLTLAMLLMGSVLAFPLLLTPMLLLLRLLPLRLVGRMALEQLARNRTRTGLTAGVLFLALAVAVGFGQSLRGILRDMHVWYGQTVVADFLLRASMPDTSFTLVTAVPDGLTRELEGLADVALVERLAFLSGEANGQDALILARTFSPDVPLPLDLREGEADEVRAGLQRGEAVVGTGLAGQLGLHRGDSITVSTAHGPETVRIAGTATEFAGGGSALYLEWSAAGRLLDLPGAHCLLVSARPGASPALGAVLRTFCAERHLILQSNTDLRDLIDALFQRVTGAIWALLVLIFLVASLGIVNTLQMNIQDQMRTFGVLRALGMKGGQIVGLVLGQALLMGGLTLLPGALAGVVLAYVIGRGSANWAGAPMAFHLDVRVLAGSCAISLLSALLAAVLPARRASRLFVLHAMA